MVFTIIPESQFLSSGLLKNDVRQHRHDFDPYGEGDDEQGASAANRKAACFIFSHRFARAVPSLGDPPEQQRMLAIWTEHLSSLLRVGYNELIESVPVLRGFRTIRANITVEPVPAFPLTVRLAPRDDRQEPR